MSNFILQELRGLPFDNYAQIQLEQTIDEVYYLGLSPEALELRNQDQVVQREFRSKPYIPILTVPQLWLWRFDNYVISSFAFAEQWDSSSAFFYSKSIHQKHETPDLYMGLVLAHHINAFSKESGFKNVKFSPTLDIFEAAMLSVLSDVDKYLREQHLTAFDINMEGDFIHRISNIRSELVMIQGVLNQQKEVLTLLLDDPNRNMPEHEDRLIKNKWASIYEAKDIIKHQFRRTEKINRDAERIEKVIQDKLNLTRTAVSMNAANASIAEARQSKLLSVIVLSFTIITFIFTFISFLATLLALDIDTFSSIKYTPSIPVDTNGPSEVYSGRKVAGIFSMSYLFFFFFPASNHTIH